MTYRSELYLIKSDNTEIPANIIANTLYLNKSYCEEEQLEIGGCIPSQFKCSVYGIEDITDIVKLKYIRYSDNEPDMSFEGNIAELTSTSNDGIYNITAYDELYNQTDISEWYNNYMANNEVVTISQLYSAVLEKLGLISGSVITNYITYDFVIKQNILSNNITGTRLLKWICEALGVFGILNTYTSTNETENGIRYTTMTTFSLNVLGPKPKTAIRPTTVFSGFQKSDYICKKMDKVQIRSEEEDIGAIYGTGTNALIIEGNPLFYGMDASELEKCAKQISGNIKDNSDYTAYEAELADSDIYINNVDIYQCYPISSSTSRIYSYIFNITWSGSQLTTCKIGANGVETRSEVLTSTNSEIIKLNYKTTSIVKNVDGIKTEVSSISSKADNALNKVDNLQIGGTNLLLATKNLGKPWIAHVSTTSNLVIDDDGFTYITLIDTWRNYLQQQKKLEIGVYTISFYAKADTSAVLEIKDDSNQVVLSKITVDTKTWKRYTSILNITKVDTDPAITFVTRQNSTRIYVKAIQLEKGNKATDWSPAPEDIEEQITSVKTSVEQTDKYIEANVVKNDEVVTKINASQEGVSIKADKISLEGYTTINDNFKIDEHGDMEAKNGKFSGEIIATSGTIGGFTITNKLTAKGQNYLPPTEADFNKIRNAAQNGTIASLYAENIWWDLDGNGKTDIYDFGIFRQIMLGKREYSSVNHKKLSDVTIEINPASTDKTIRIYGTNAWGSLVDTYIGSVSSSIDNLSVTGLNCSHGLAIGSNDVWTEEQGLKAQGDIIAGLGTDNQVSLQGLKDSFVKVTGTTRSSTAAGTATELDYPTGFTRDNSMVVGFEIQVGNDWYSTDTNGKFPQPILGRKIWVDSNNCASTWASRPFRIMLIKM